MSISVQPPKLNEILKQNRDRKRASLQMAHQDTRISVQYLQALEAGEYEKFPAEVYCLGFLRKYAVYLGLNPDEMVAMYKKEQDAQKEIVQEEEKKQESTDKQEKSNELVKVASLILLLVVCGGLWLYSVVTPVRKPAPAPVPIPAAAAKPAPILPPPVESLTLHAFTQDGVWMRVLLDRKLSFEGFIVTGASRTWEAKDEIFLRIGNVRAVRLTLNGQAIDPKSGAAKDVNDLVLTRDTLKKRSETAQ